MITFQNQNIDFKLSHKRYINRWIRNNIKSYSKKVGDISYIFTNDSSILDINKKFLNHDYYTDIITFDYCQDNIIAGDIFISIDRIKDNSKIYNTIFSEELLRVIIHGILHLVGFNDHSDKEKKEMRNQENSCLKRININKFKSDK